MLQERSRRRRRVLRRGPAHQWVLPAFPSVKVHLPLLGAADSGLHGGFGWYEDVDFAGFDVFLWDPCQSGYVLGDDQK